MRLKNKVAVITGAGSGMGRAMAEAFAAEGARLVLADISGAQNEVAAALGDAAVAVHANVAEEADVRNMIATAEEKFGRLDILCNNAGFGGGMAPLHEQTTEAWDRVHAVNLKSVFLSCKHAIPVMERQGGGVITNISSIASVRWTGISYLAYSSSKAALNQVTRTIARQYAARQIRCNAILPGYLDTPHIRTLYAHLDADAFAATQRERDAHCPMGYQGSAWDVAHAAVFLASDDARYITGNLLIVDGGASL